MPSLKDQLLTSARQRAYYKLGPADLEVLWNASESFIDKGRLQSLEIEWYALLEQHFFLSLLTCRDAVAKLMLKRIMEKIGVDSRRVYMLRTAYVRATQEPGDVEKHMKNLNEIEYDARKIGSVALKSAGKWREYVGVLVEYLEQNPLDAEAWAELAETYATLGDYSSAVHSLEQCLLLEPMAYNVFARIGELKKLQAAGLVSGSLGVAKELIQSSEAHFCRAVELNPLYLRGWAGLYVVTGISTSPTAEKLNEKAHTMLGKLMNNGIGSPADVYAAKELLGFS